MSSYSPSWRSNLRANLILWPSPSQNVISLSGLVGQPYSEATFAASFPANDARAVRQTVEVMNLAGIAYRDDTDVFRLTELGESALSFLAPGPPKLANERNLPVLGDLFARGLGAVVEFRAIWMLMRQAENILDNEELNRAMNRIRHTSDIPAVARDILKARDANDPTSIGARFYAEHQYADPAVRTDQRKAIHPIFLLAGAGGILISMDAGEG